MKILLSTIPTEGQFVNWTTHKYFMPDEVNKYIPLGILSLASNIVEDYEVVIIDPPSDGMSMKNTINKINKESPDILGLSVVTRRVYAMREILKNVEVPYKAVGGPHATHYANQILNFGADVVFRGPLTDIEFNNAIKDSPKGIIDCNTQINEINYPNRNLLDVKKYFPKESKLFRADNRLPMFSSIGCPNRCTFCNVQTKIVQYKKPNIILDEMEHLKSVGCRSIHILDDNFNINRNHVIRILQEMEKRNFNMEWSGRGQVRTDLSLAPRLHESGFKRIHVGIESLSDKTLKFFNKRETLNDVYRFCKEMNKNSIDILGYFILGSPTETHVYRKQLPEKIRELGIKHPFINILFPEPNTEYYNSLLRNGIFDKDYWKEYMEDPIPNYELPYPYGKNKKEEIWSDIQDVVDEFKREV